MRRLLMLFAPAIIACGSGAKAPATPAAAPVAPPTFVCHSDSDCGVRQFCRVEVGVCADVLPGLHGVAAVRKGSTAVIGWRPLGGATNYEVGKTTRVGGVPEPLGTTVELSYVDLNPPTIDRIWYAVRAVLPEARTEWSYGFLEAVPPPPTDVTTASLIHGIRVTWLNGGAFQNVYTVQRSATAAGVFAAVATVQGSFDVLQSYDDVGLGVSEQWFYRVVTTFFDVVGTPSASVGGVTEGPPPPAPAAVSATLIDDGFLPSVTWSPSRGALRYLVSMNGDLLDTVTGTSFIAVRNRLATDTTVSFDVVAQNDGGDSAATTSNSITTAPGALYGTVSATGGVSQAAITWTDRPRGYPVTYRLLRGPSGGPFADIAAVPDFTFTDTTTGDWATFCYEIVVDFGSGRTPPSSVSCTETRGPPDQLNAGTAPLGIAHQDGHTVYGQTFAVRQTGQLVGFEISPSNVLNASSLVVRLFAGDAYLTSFNAQFLGGPITTPPLPLERNSNGNFYFDLTSLNEKIYLAAGGNLRFDVPPTFQGPFFLQLGTTPGDAYTGGAATIDGVPTTDGTDLVFKTVIRPVAENLTAPAFFTAAPAPDRIVLSWPGIAGAASYRLARSGDGGTTFADIARPSATTYFDPDLPSGATFTYRLTPVGLSGAQGPASTTVATTKGTLDGQRLATGLLYGGPAIQQFTASATGLLTGVALRTTGTALDLTVTDASGTAHGPVTFRPPVPPQDPLNAFDTTPFYVDVGALGVHVNRGDALSFTATVVATQTVSAFAAGADPGGGFTLGATFVPDQAIWYQTFVH